MVDGLFAINELATVSGCSLAVFLLTQLTKNLIDKLIHIPTDVLSVIYAFITLVLSQLSMGAANTWELYFLSAMNSLIVSATAAQINVRALKATGVSKNGSNDAPNISITDTNEP